MLTTTSIETASSTAPETMPTGFLLTRREFTFVTDDPRIRNRENVTMFVVNANSVRDAKQMIREFLEDVERYGLRID